MIHLYQYIVDYFKHSPTIIQLSWALCAVFVLITTILILYLKYLRSRLRTKERIQKVYENKYESELISYLYSGNENEEISDEQQIIIKYLKKCSENSLKRKIIISTLLKLRNEISGEMADSIQKLYYQTGLIDYASSKLKSKKWDVVAKGIRELAQFQVKEVHDEIILHINHPKREVRKELHMYLVNSFQFKGLDFLNIIKTQLSEWDQIQLLEILQRFDNQHIPDIKPWLLSSNYSVASFALKLAKIYNQYESKDTLLELLKHANQTIRIDTIDVLTHLNVPEAVTILKKDFTNRTIEEQVAFFKMMENMYESHDGSFLFRYMNHENFEIKSSAIKILKALTIDTFNPLETKPVNPKISETVTLIKAS